MIIQDIKTNKNKVVKVDMESSGLDLKPGDMYVVRRNTGWELLTCDFVTSGWVVSKESAFCYNICVCHKVIDCDILNKDGNSDI